MPVRQESLSGNWVRIGHIAGAAGLRGEVKLYHDSGDAAQLTRVIDERIPVSIAPIGRQIDAAAPAGSKASMAAPSSAIAPFFIERLRYQGRVPILKLPGVDDRNTAEALIGYEVFAPTDRLRPEEPDAYLVSDLIGLRAVSEDEPYEIGIITSVIDNPAHDILEIETPDGRRALLPMVDAYILDIDLAGRCVRVRVPEGLLE